ncbi:hypothetical protein HPB47_006081 [Ixodes persulcatus]|uniref:Uncharacterized protein n=1 Tax=Ixodes persulcatus TaxID=34615 RepID=A0AC60PC57_IXOPE|nr:hypothetical protein HPB47_006081 [Ixodes persulcatus]
MLKADFGLHTSTSRTSPEYGRTMASEIPKRAREGFSGRGDVLLVIKERRAVIVAGIAGGWCQSRRRASSCVDPDSKCAYPAFLRGEEKKAERLADDQRPYLPRRSPEEDAAVTATPTFTQHQLALIAPGERRGRVVAYLSFAVCAVHFDPSCIERTTSYTDPRTGKVLEAALPVPCLRPGSVPKLFPACPSYLSKPVTNTRDAPDTKKSRQEASQLARALEESAASFEVELERHRFSTLEELKACLQVASVSVKWTVIHQEKCTMFLNIDDECEPWLKASLTVFENLQVSACYQGAPVKRFASSVVPDSVRDVSSLHKILDNLCMLSDEGCSSRHLLGAVTALLDKLEGSVSEGKKEAVKFLKEQLLLLCKGCIRY